MFLYFRNPQFLKMKSTIVVFACFVALVVSAPNGQGGDHGQNHDGDLRHAHNGKPPLFPRLTYYENKCVGEKYETEGEEVEVSIFDIIFNVIIPKAFIFLRPTNAYTSYFPIQ